MVIDLSADRLARKNSSTSKGNQPKWFKDGRWYKADQLGYEALAETVISRLLTVSNINNFVKYELVRIQYGDTVYNGCASDNFKGDNETVIPIEKLYRINTGKSLSEKLGKIADVKDRIIFAADSISRFTGICGFGEYFTLLLEIDAFFLNEDRHTNNIAVIKNDGTGKFAAAPIFDNGLALLSDISEYGLETDTEKNMLKVKAKPFSTDFDEQLDAAEELFGQQIKFGFTQKDVDEITDSARELYAADIVNRVKLLLYDRMRKYAYLFE